MILSRPSRVARATAPDPFPDLRGLRGYQGEGALWLRARLRARLGAILADEMGLGKTAQALRALPRRARAVVVCPASVLLVWEEESRRWRPDLAVGQLDLRAPREGEILLSSYDSLPDPAPGRRGLLPDDLSSAILVLDEAHRAAHPEARRTRAVRRLRAQCASAWGLTGTPMVGTPRDLRELLATLGLFEEAFPGGREEYDALCRAERRTYRRRSGALAEYEAWGKIDGEVAARFRRVALRRRLSDHLELPPETWVEVPCEAPADLREHLDEVTEAWDRYDPAELPPFELYSAATAALARSRAAAARDLAADVARARPVLVFSAHLAPVEAVSTLPGAVRITGAETDAERAEAVAAFRSGRARILAATSAGGEGLNLPETGAAILVDEGYVPSDTDQKLARARGAVSHGGLLVYRMTSDHPLDRRIREILDEKRRMIRQAIG